MKRSSTLVAILAAGSLLSAQTQSSVSTTKTATKHHSQKKAETVTAEDVRELREQLREQQAEIDSLKSMLTTHNEQVATAQKTASDAQAQAVAASSVTAQLTTTQQESSSQIASLQSTVNDLKTTDAGLQETLVANQTNIKEQIESPATIHYKGVQITPVGFLAAETVVRTRSLNSDINTPFNSTPFMNSGQAYTSEFNGTARQSRIGLNVLAPTSWGRMRGYYEADFLGTGITSNNNQSTSYVLRQRQVWAQVGLNNGFTFTGGQLWSLVTETKHGVDPTTEALPNTVDPNYHVGFSWTRQYGVRFAQAFNNNKEVIALSLEEPQIVNYTSSTTPPDFFVGSIGANGGLFNLTNKYSNNIAPDLVIKFAADPGFGHYEIGGIARWDRARIYPNQTATVSSSVGAYNNTVSAGGFFANARFSAVPKLIDIGLHVMGGDGVNRYGTSQLADITVHPDGTLEPIRGAQGLLSIETHPSPKLDVYGYAGTEYAQRTYYISGTTITGYAPPTINTSTCYTEQATAPPATGSTGGVFGGAPYDPSSSCPAQTRDITEGSIGFTYRFFNTASKGRIQYQMVYSYLTKTAWVGTAGAPHATNNMVFTGFRYYIP
jgi:hypothetical protein